MTPELVLLLLASMVALQIVGIVARRERREEAPYLALCAVDLTLLTIIHLTGRHGTLPAFVAEGVACVLGLGPRLLDMLERGALSRDDFARASRIAQLRELIVPGRASTRRRRQLADLAAASGGDARKVVKRLREEIARAESPTQERLLREELATVLFFDQRYAEGLAEVETHLGLDHAAGRPLFGAYVLRAYGEVGQLARAATVMSLLEEGPAGKDPGAAGLLYQARLTFLAYAGCLPHVEAMLSGAAGSLLPDRAHAFLKDMARMRARNHEKQPLPPEVKALAEAVFSRATHPSPVPESPPKKRTRPWATLALLAANVLAMGAFVLLVRLSAPGDDTVLVRAGALFRPAVQAGEWWRLFTMPLLHAGLLHVAVNLYGLFLLGRFAEEILGARRLLAVYLTAGASGALVSTLLGRSPLSIGASGAVLGLLGALVVILLRRRSAWPDDKWRRALLWNLVLLGALQIWLGFQIPMHDNAAHLGGLIGGALATLLLLPREGDGSRASRALATVLAAALVATTLGAAVQVARTPLAATLARLPVREVKVGGVALSVPAHWQVDASHGRVEDPWLGIIVTPKLDGGRVGLEATGAADSAIAALIDRIRASARALP
jgi:membrane associated rhomboid family serine protease